MGPHSTTLGESPALRVRPLFVFMSQVPVVILTGEQLQQIMPRLRQNQRAAETVLEPLNEALAEFQINTPLRVAAFLATVAHESGEFKWMQEIWGPTKQQIKYDPPGRLAKQLGNTQAGDGKRYMGRGPIQLTGRGNYRRFGTILGLPLETQPELAAQLDHGIRIAACFWQTKDLNVLADRSEFTKITERVNGGHNGLAERLVYFERAKTVLGIGAQKGSDPV